MDTDILRKLIVTEGTNIKGFQILFSFFKKIVNKIAGHFYHVVSIKAYKDGEMIIRKLQGL